MLLQLLRMLVVDWLIAIFFLLFFLKAPNVLKLLNLHAWYQTQSLQSGPVVETDGCIPSPKDEAPPLAPVPVPSASSSSSC